MPNCIYNPLVNSQEMLSVETQIKIRFPLLNSSKTSDGSQSELSGWTPAPLFIRGAGCDVTPLEEGVTNSREYK